MSAKFICLVLCLFMCNCAFSQVQIHGKEFFYSDTSRYQYNIVFGEDSKFKAIGRFENSTCCSRLFKGYYLFTGDTLVMTYVPRRYGKESRYEVVKSSVSDSLQVEIFYKADTTPLRGNLLVIERNRSINPFFFQESLIDQKMTNMNGLANLKIDSPNYLLRIQWVGFYPLEIDTKELIGANRLKVYLSNTVDNLHESWNEEYFIEKYLVTKNNDESLKLISFENGKQFFQKIEN